MNVSEAIASRHSVRAFLDRPLEKELVMSLLEHPTHAINAWRTERAPLKEFVEWHGL